MACMASSCLKDSGMFSRSSPVSRLFFASILIFARRRLVKLSAHVGALPRPAVFLPILEPDLNRPFGHVNLLRDTFTRGSGGRGVLVELHFQRHQLILC